MLILAHSRRDSVACSVAYVMAYVMAYVKFFLPRIRWYHADLRGRFRILRNWGLTRWTDPRHDALNGFAVSPKQSPSERPNNDQ